MKIKSDKCQTTDEFSFIDSLFTVFERSFAIEQIRKYIEKNKIKPIVMDIGCYKGQLFSYLIQNRIFVDYIGLDIRKDYLEKSILKRKDVWLIEQDITEPFYFKDVDIVVCLEILEHIEQSKINQVIRNVSNSLTKNGIFIVACPLNSNEKIFHYYDKEKTLGHVNFFTKEDLIELCNKNNLQLQTFFPGYSLKSSYRFKDMGQEHIYQQIKFRLGSQIARAFYLSLISEENGGGRFVFQKVND